jgi:hypothetical protein
MQVTNVADKGFGPQGPAHKAKGICACGLSLWLWVNAKTFFWIISKRVGRIIRIQGVKGSSKKCLSNYKELEVWQRSYQLCLEI